jgi:hypothetical protein
MNCERFRQLVQDRCDGRSVGTEATAMDAHAASCEACRAYEAEMSAVLDALDDLRSMSTITPDESAGRAGGFAGVRRWTGVGAMAAGVILAVLAGIAVESFLTRSPNDLPGIKGPVTVAGFSPVVQLSDESAAKFIAVPAPPEEPNVHVVWLHQVLPPASETSGGSGRGHGSNGASS